MMLTKPVIRLDYNDLVDWLVDTFNLDRDGKHDIISLVFPDGLTMKGEERECVLLTPDEPCDHTESNMWNTSVTSDINTLLEKSADDWYYRYKIDLHYVLYFARLHGIIPHEEIFIHHTW